MAQAPPRAGVDQLDAARAQVVEGGLQVGHRERDVVEALAPGLHEARDGALGIERRDQLHLAALAAAEHRLHALLCHDLAEDLRQAQRPLQLGERPIEVGDDVAHVVEWAQHGGYPTRSRRGLGCSSRPTFAHGTPSTRTTSAV